MTIKRLSLVDASPEGQRAASELAALIVPDDPAGSAFWTNAARHLLEWVMLYQSMHERPEGRTAASLIAVLSNPAALMETIGATATATVTGPGWDRLRHGASSLRSLDAEAFSSVIATAMAGVSNYARRQP